MEAAADFGATLQARLEEHLASRGLRVPEQLRSIYSVPIPAELEGLLYDPSRGSAEPPGLKWAEELIDASGWPLLPNLVPLLPVDDQSFACVVVSDAAGEPLPGEGRVVRWHLGVERESQQAAVLDTDCEAYVQSMAEELAARKTGLHRMLDEIGPAYDQTHLSKEKRPRDFVLRPIRVACQNVIVALAAIAQDSSFDGLSVLAWQTCEVPHVAAHEANRALTVITLCDAFQNGGTMEVRFDQEATLTVKGKRTTLKGHPEHGRVPASLRRFGRTVGVELGKADRSAISPGEARDLFKAVTPMPDELRGRFERAVSTQGITPERLCFALCKPVWRQIELDWLLATSPRVSTILEGGSPWTQRSARQAEAETCRTAVMAGMLFRRLDATDAAGASGSARLVEDRRHGVRWSVEAGIGAIRFSDLPPDIPLPWAATTILPASGEILAAFRTLPTTAIGETLLEAAGDATPLLVIAEGGARPVGLPDGIVLLECPDRFADIDKTVETNLTSSRVSRA